MKRITIALFTMLALTCCKKESVEENPDKTGDEVKTGKVTLADVTSIDLNDAKLIVQYTPEKDREGAMLTNAGELVTLPLKVNGVPFEDDFSVEEVTDINESYALLRLISADTPSKRFLLEKSTGKLFLTDLEYLGNTLDAKNNVYFMSGGYVVRVNLDDPTSLSKNELTPQEDVYDFAVSSNGDIIYTTSGDVMRAVSSDGTMTTISGYGSPFTGADGNLHYFTQKDGDKSTYLATVSFDPISVSYSTSAYNVEYYEFTTADVVKNKEVVVYKSSDVLYHLNANNELVSTVEESDWGIDNFSRLQVTDDYYYIVYNSNAGDVIRRVNPLSPKTDYFDFVIGDYELEEYDIAPDGTVYFYATKSSNLEQVFGEISPSGEVSIITNDFGHQPNFVFLP